MRELPVSGALPAQANNVEEQQEITLLLLDALQKLADAGEVDAACRLAGKACVVLRRSSPGGERRFNALLHRLTRSLG